MKVAIIHDHISYLGGAERVLFTILKIYPTADVYTAFTTKENLKLLKNKIKGKVNVSWFNHLPFSRYFMECLKPFIFGYWEQLDLSAYNLVISSSHSFSAKSVLTSPQALHISYIHTPPRYLYLEFNETQIINQPFLKLLLSPLLSQLRLQDYLGGQRPDILVANSKTVQARIKKYYRRNSMVIYPPVAIPKVNSKRRRKEYYLTVSRLAKQKGVDLAIKACNKLKLPLMVVGEGKEKSYLQSIAGPTIKFCGFVTDEKMADLYAKAKALIYCSKDEDFGLTPVEAMAQGVPVIGYNSGGVRETVIHGKTGLLFSNYTVFSLAKTIIFFQTIHISPSNCRRQAKKFSEEVFIKKFKQLIKISTQGRQ